MFAPVGFGVSYLVFPLLFFLFFIIVGATAVVTRLRSRQPKPLPPPVERLCAVVRQKQVIAGAHHPYRAVFLLETGGEKAFLLTRVQYCALAEGVDGALVYKGERFLCFEQRNERTV